MPEFLLDDRFSCCPGSVKQNVSVDFPPGSDTGIQTSNITPTASLARNQLITMLSHMYIHASTCTCIYNHSNTIYGISVHLLHSTYKPIPSSRSFISSSISLCPAITAHTLQQNALMASSEMMTSTSVHGSLSRWTRI